MKDIIKKGIEIVKNNPSIGRIKLAQLLGINEMLARNIIFTAKFLMEELEVENKYQIPSYNFHIPSPNKVFIFSDIHFPFEDAKALEIAVNECIKYEPQTIIINGDLLDFYDISPFPKKHNFMDMIDGLNKAKHFLRELRLQFPEARIYFREGNHEERLRNFIMKKVGIIAEVLEIHGINTKDMLELEDLDIVFVKSEDKLYLDNLLIYHGHEVGLRSVSVKYVAQHLLNLVKTSMIVGHWHIVDTRAEYRYEVKNGKLEELPIQVWCIGSLCQRHLPYLKQNPRFMNGFCYINVFEDGYFDVNNKKIINYRVVSA